MRRIISFFDRANSISDPELAPDETMILETIGISNRGILVPQGRLLLTSRRVIFQPFRFPFWPRRFWPQPQEVALLDIFAVTPGPMYLFLPGFTLLTRRNRELRYQTIQAKAWRTAIANLIETDTNG
jgi:hypothetical protein